MAIELRYPVPPVCTAQWDEDAWARWIERHGVRVNTEPATLDFGGGVWARTGKRNEKGEMLYRRADSPGAPGSPGFRPGTPFEIDSCDWHDGQGFDLVEGCTDLASWEAYKAELEGVSDMTFRLRDADTNEVIDTWRAPR